MKNINVLRLFNVLNAIRQRAEQTGQQDFSGRFAVLAAYNIGMLRPQAETLSNAIQVPGADIIAKYHPEELKLLQEHAILADGETINPSRFYGIKDNAAWEAARDALKAQFPGLEDALKAQQAAEALLQQESPTILLQKIRIEDVPGNLSLTEGEILMYMVDLPEVEAVTGR